MPNWKNACTGDLKRLAAIQLVLKNYPHLVDRLFHPTEPYLRTSPQGVSRGLSSGERTLVGIATDLWNESFGAKVYDLAKLDDSNFENVIAALRILRTI
jgi:hypothetical protein